ncbi:thiamine biosynthesis lipoprotein [Halopseudomonas xinjiangensis]|uniref:FAD:protein FMN transferase n=1 Tax=Halopseudomonas xinjiangensis TaxID=487184 RepID=A0A1H1RND7_9GAMM|nr:FAD:protein FMN transferase [Halopseudomonas xinjiangensis]SDS37215.1 thiamine biosynthesis lipoprotein [Halopseudomonas xinjiangensis]
MLRRVTQPVIAVALAAALTGCFNSAEPVLEVTGSTMGSSYSIKWVGVGDSPEPAALQASLEAMFEQFDREVSGWREDSDLASFNASPVGACRQIPESLVDLVKAAESLNQRSGGAFDITVGPLLDLWGFHGPVGKHVLPGDDELRHALERVGQHHLRLDGDQLCKDADVLLDISGLAAGYMVDEVVEHLGVHGITSYMVEITGELKAAGLKPGGSPWRIAIEEPRDDDRVAQLILPLDGYGVSTSGDYRNFFEYEGKRYSHTFNPRSGTPVMHQLAAVTVLHPSTMQADGLSTVLHVLGPEEGWEFALAHDVAALFVVRQGTGFVSRATPEFNALRKGKE